jgi:hypothetical protein
MPLKSAEEDVCMTRKNNGEKLIREGGLTIVHKKVAQASDNTTNMTTDLQNILGIDARDSEMLYVSSPANCLEGFDIMILK